MWVETTPWVAVLWTLGEVLAYCGLQVLLHKKRRTVHLTELKTLTNEEAVASILFVAVWISLQVFLFSDWDFWNGRSLGMWMGLTIDFRSVLGCVTIFTMSCVLFFGTFLESVLTDSLPTFLSSLSYGSPLFHSLLTELLFRSLPIPLLRSSSLSGTLTTCLITLWSGLGSLHLCYYFGRVRRSWSRALAEMIMGEAIEQLFVGFIGARIFIVTGRLYPSLLLHSFVAILHIPDGYFLHQNHPAHRYCRVLGSAYVFGLVSFFAMHLALLEPTAYNSPFY